MSTTKGINGNRKAAASELLHLRIFALHRVELPDHGDFSEGPLEKAIISDPAKGQKGQSGQYRRKESIGNGLSDSSLLGKCGRNRSV